MAPLVVAALETGILGGILWVLSRIPVLLGALRDDYRSPAVERVELRVRDLERVSGDLLADLERVRTYVREEREATERAAERARFHARRARQEREADVAGPEFEPEGSNGGGGETGGVPAVRADVARDPGPEEVRAAARRAIALRM